MPHVKNGASQCPLIRTLKQAEKIKFSDLIFKPFVFDGYQGNNQPKYSCVFEVKRTPGIYVVKDISSNKVFRFGSSKNDLYEQISLFVQHYKIQSGSAVIAFLKVLPDYIEVVTERIRLTHRSELTDDTFFKIVPLVLENQPVPVGLIDFFSLYNESPSGPRPINRIKSNITHLSGRDGIYVIQIKPKKKKAWHIEYVGRATGLHGRIHAHFIRSQSEYRPNSNYYHLRGTHDFKIGIIEFPRNEKALIPKVEAHLIEQWDPPGNRYGRGLSKEEIATLSSNGYKPIDTDVTF